MAHISSRRCWALIGMGAVTGLAVMMPTPAHAETIELLCVYESSTLRLYIDTDRQSVVRLFEDKRIGPFAASISDTLISWTERYPNWEIQYRIDRGTGTINEVRYYQGSLNLNRSLQCRRATQKF